MARYKPVEYAQGQFISISFVPSHLIDPSFRPQNPTDLTPV